MYCLILDNIYTLWPAFFILFLVWSLNDVVILNLSVFEAVMSVCQYFVTILTGTTF